MRKVLKELKKEEEDATKIYCDNNSMIALSNNPFFHKRSKHIEIVLEHCRSMEQYADIFSKTLGKESFVHQRD